MHDHGSAQHRAGARHVGPLRLALALTVSFLVVQLVTGIVTGSLALLSDAGHMATDTLGLGMALAAVHLASVPARRPQRTFGLYRLEILAALANAVLLFGVAAYVIVEAARRLGDAPDIDALPVLVVGCLGLVVNLVAYVLLRPGAAESINVRGASLEVLADALGSVGVITAAIVWGITDWAWVDPVIGAAIGLFILPRGWRLGRDAVRVLVQEAPEGVDLPAMQADLDAIDGVTDVHDLHVWTLTSEMEVATAHLRVGAGVDPNAVLEQARDVLAHRHGIRHATLQVEPDGSGDCSELDW